MQTKLHHWAAADPGRRFDDLFNFGLDPPTPTCWSATSMPIELGRRSTTPTNGDRRTPDVLRPGRDDGYPHRLGGRQEGGVTLKLGLRGFVCGAPRLRHQRSALRVQIPGCRRVDNDRSSTTASSKRRCTTDAEIRP